MQNYILNRDVEGKVAYVYRNDGKHPVKGYTSWKSAKWMLTNDKKREIRMTEDYAGFPLTADGVYFFDGYLLPAESQAPSCGLDYCEIPELESGVDGATKGLARVLRENDD